jgi:hypothetical protein
MLPVEMLTYAVVAASACSYLIWKLPGPCACEKCGYHVQERKDKDAMQTIMQHDMQHKGHGYGAGWPDKYDCADIACKRNKTNRPTEG